MPTRTFRGTIDGDWHKAGNWLEGAVPVAGDDVVFDSSSPNCYISSNVPASGRLQTLNMSGYNNTFTFNGNKIFIGPGDFAGTIFNGGSTCNFSDDNGTIEFYTTSTSTSGRNIIVATNPNLAKVNFDFDNNAVSRTVFFSGTNHYMKNLKVIKNGIVFYGNYDNLYINGNIDLSIASTQLSSAALSNNGNAGNIIHILNNATISAGNGIILLNNANLYIYGRLTMLSSLYIATTRITGEIKFLNNGEIIQNTEIFTLVNSSTAGTITIYFNNKPINNLCLAQVTNAYINTFRIDTLTVNRLFFIKTPMFPLGLHPTVRNLIVRSHTNGQQVNVTLGSACKHYVCGVNFTDINFTKPIKVFNSVFNNCTNVENIEFPTLITSGF